MHDIITCNSAYESPSKNINSNNEDYIEYIDLKYSHWLIGDYMETINAQFFKHYDIGIGNLSVIVLELLLVVVDHRRLLVVVVMVLVILMATTVSSSQRNMTARSLYVIVAVALSKMRTPTILYRLKKRKNMILHLITWLARTVWVVMDCFWRGNQRQSMGLFCFRGPTGWKSGQGSEGLCFSNADFDYHCISVGTVWSESRHPDFFWHWWELRTQKLWSDLRRFACFKAKISKAWLKSHHTAAPI